MISKAKLLEEIEELKDRTETLKDKIYDLYDLIKKKDEELEAMRFKQNYPMGVIVHGFCDEDRFICKHVYKYRYAGNGKINVLFLTNTEEPVLVSKFNISSVGSTKIFITYEDKKWLIDTIRNIKMEIPSELYEYKC